MPTSFKGHKITQQLPPFGRQSKEVPRISYQFVLHVARKNSFLTLKRECATPVSNREEKAMAYAELDDGTFFNLYMDKAQLAEDALAVYDDERLEIEEEEISYPHNAEQRDGVVTYVFGTNGVLIKVEDDTRNPDKAGLK